MARAAHMAGRGHGLEGWVEAAFLRSSCILRWMQSRKEGRVKALFMLSTVNTYRVPSECPTVFQSLRRTAADLTATLVQLSVHTDVHPYCYQPTWCSAGECRLGELPEWCSRESDPARVCVCARGDAAGGNHRRLFWGSDTLSRELKGELVENNGQGGEEVGTFQAEGSAWAKALWQG